MLRVIFFLLAIIASAIVGVITTPFGAFAAQQCDLRENVISLLQKKYKENQVAQGVTTNGGLVEVFSTETGSTWSIIVTTPQGMSCLVAAGDGWRSMEPVSKDPGA